MNRLTFKIKTQIEHQLQHLGLYAGLVLAGLSVLLYFVDIKLFLGSTPHLYTTDSVVGLVSLNNTLSAILISILVTTFSVVFVVMQLASSQFSPRILRYFLYSDVRIQQFIGLLLGVIAMIYLPQVLSLVFGTNIEILQFSILLPTVISFYCLLISFPRVISHLSDNMNVASITNRIKLEIVEEIDILYDNQWNVGDALVYKRKSVDYSKDYIKFFWTGESGYLSEVNYALMSKTIAQLLGQTQDAHTYQKTIVGEFILKDTTPILVISFDKVISDDEKENIKLTLAPLLANIFIVNKYRSNTQDVNFGVRKLVDIAIKAISPAINDPTTCLNCIDHLGEIVRRLAVCQFPSKQAMSLEKKHIYTNEFSFNELIDFCFDQIIQWGKNDPTVVKRIIRIITDIIPHVSNPYNLMVLIRQVEEMELAKIYQSPESLSKFTKEQCATIEREYKRFEEKAIEQIQLMKLSGVLEQYKDSHYIAGNDCIQLLESKLVL
jgi:uncharacterized membrane protein